MLNEIPRNHLRVYTSMGDDMPLSSWTIVDTSGVSGEEIYQCLERGRIWINIQRIDQLDGQYKRLSELLYSSLSRQLDNFKPSYIHTYLLLSSPGVAVNYHLDAYENFFWCLKGKKTFYLFDVEKHPELCSQHSLEDICAGADDFIAYRPEFHQLSQRIEIEEG